MKREFLKGFEGLTDEVIDKIMSEHGKAIEAEKAKYNSYKSENEALKADKKTLEDKIAELSENANTADDYKSQLDKLKADIAKKEEEDKKAKEDAELTGAIEAVFGDKEFSSDYVRRGVIADMKTEIAKPENKGKGYTEIFESLTKDKDGIFKNPNPPADMEKMGGVGTNEVSEAAMRTIMGLDPVEK